MLNQLRSWTPRHPSAKLRARLFSTAGVGGLELGLRATWQQLAPAAALLLMAFVTLNSRNVHTLYWPEAGINRVLTTAAVSNLTAASYVTTADACDRNSFPAATFASTSAAATPSSNGSFLQFNTNGLIR